MIIHRFLNGAAFSLVPALVVLCLENSLYSAEDLPRERGSKTEPTHELGFDFKVSSNLAAEDMIPGAGNPGHAFSNYGGADPISDPIQFAIVDELVRKLQIHPRDWLGSSVEVIHVIVAIVNLFLLYFLFQVGRRIAVADERRINSRNLRTFWLRNVLVERNFHLVSELYDLARMNALTLIEAVEEQRGRGENLQIGVVSGLGKKFSGEFSNSYSVLVSRFIAPLHSLMPACSSKIEERLDKFEKIVSEFFADPDLSMFKELELEISIGPSEIMKMLWQAEETFISDDNRVSDSSSNKN